MESIQQEEPAFDVQMLQAEIEIRPKSKLD